MGRFTRPAGALVFSLLLGCGARMADEPVVDAAPAPADTDPDAAAARPLLSCRAIDILFVIDNSSSMYPHQTSLAYAFPGFVDAMYERLPVGVSLHIGITTTSFFVGSCAEGPDETCHSGASTEEIRAHYIPPSASSTGENGGQGRLFSYGGKRFFSSDTSEADRAPLKRWFSGAATAVGQNGCTFEMPAAAGAYAMDPSNLAANADFLRDEDSLLLIVVLTNEPDKSPEPVAAYADRVRAAKRGCGGDRCIVTAALVDPCIKNPAVKDPLWQFLNAFGKAPIAGDIRGISTQYAQVVGAALAEVVKEACIGISIN